MAGLKPDEERAVRDEAQRVVRELAGREARRFVDEERKRTRGGFKFLAGFNVAVLLALFASTRTFVRETVERQVKLAVVEETVHLEDRVKRMHSVMDEAFLGLGEQRSEAESQASGFARLAEERAGQLNDLFQENKTDFEQLAKGATELAGFNDPAVFAELTAWASGEGKQMVRLLKEKVEAATGFERIRWQTLPVGSIIAWHETPEGVNIPRDLVGPEKPWRRCNGGLVTDAGPFQGKRLPNLNDTTKPPLHGYAGGRFLRGGMTSGTLQKDAFQGHHHAIARSDSGVEPILTVADGNGNFLGNGKADQVGEKTKLNAVDAKTDRKSGKPRTAKETRPVNMSVVWIIRVK